MHIKWKVHVKKCDTKLFKNGNIMFYNQIINKTTALGICLV